MAALVIAVDTNVLLRHLMHDDPAQSTAATALLAAAVERNEGICVSLPVICETAWALKAVYRLSRPQQANVLDALFNDTALGVEERPVLLQALSDFRSGPADFPDYLIGRLALERGCSAVYSFDRKLKGTPGFSILS